MDYIRTFTYSLPDDCSGESFTITAISTSNNFVASGDELNGGVKEVELVLPLYLNSSSKDRSATIYFTISNDSNSYTSESFVFPLPSEEYKNYSIKLIPNNLSSSFFKNTFTLNVYVSINGKPGYIKEGKTLSLTVLSRSSGYYYSGNKWVEGNFFYRKNNEWIEVIPYYYKNGIWNSTS